MSEVVQFDFLEKNSKFQYCFIILNTCLSHGGKEEEEEENSVQ